MTYIIRTTWTDEDLEIEKDISIMSKNEMRDYALEICEDVEDDMVGVAFIKIDNDVETYIAEFEFDFN